MYSSECLNSYTRFKYHAFDPRIVIYTRKFTTPIRIKKPRPSPKLLILESAARCLEHSDSNGP